MKLKIALAELPIIWNNPERNRLAAAACLARAARARADLAVLPEMCLTGVSPQAARSAEPYKSSAAVDFFRAFCRQYRQGVVFGAAFREAGQKKASNTALYMDPSGTIRSRYDKIHPFSYHHEDRWFASGNKLAFFKLGGSTAALAICYDLRFPGLFEAIARRGPEIIIVIANWPASRQRHWEQLLAARALDTQSFVIGVNCTGRNGAVAYGGGSAVFSPWGERLPAKKSGSLRLIAFDPAEARRLRRSFPSLHDKRYSLYPSL